MDDEFATTFGAIDEEGDENCETLLDKPFVRIPFIAAYITVFLICLIGNLFTILVICAHRSMRTATNFFLANLALADLLVAIFCILQNMIHLLGRFSGHWPFGEMLCKLYAFVLHLVPCTGIGILVCVSVEKYIAVLHPLLALKLLTPRFRFLMMAAIWAISLICSLPYWATIHYQPYMNMAACSRVYKENEWMTTRNLITLSFVIWYCIPLCTIAFLYTRVGLVLWHSAPLKKLTQPALRTNSNETSMAVLSGGQNGTNSNGPEPQKKRSLVALGYRMSASAGTAAMGELAKLAGLRSSKRSNSQPTPSGTNPPPGPGNLLPLIRVNRTETAPSSESGGEGSQIDEEEEEEEGEEMDEAMGMMGKGTEKTTKMGEQQSGIAQKNSLPSSGGGAAVVVSTVESRKKIIRLLIAIVCSFAILTLPNHLRLLHSVWSNQHMILCGPEELVQPITYLLFFISNSCNPFLYAFMSQRFRSAIRDIFKCRRGRVRRKSTRTRTQNSDTVGCAASSGGEGLSRCSSLSRLNGAAKNGAQNELHMVGSERNLVIIKQQREMQNGNHLKVNSPAFGKDERSGSSGGSASTAFSVVYATQRPNGSVHQMAVVYRKCA